MGVVNWAAARNPEQNVLRRGTGLLPLLPGLLLLAEAPEWVVIAGAVPGAKAAP